MYHLGYCEHYLSLKRKYQEFTFSAQMEWTLKEYGTLFVYDLIKSNDCKRVLEIGPGYSTFFAENLRSIGVEYWGIDRSNDYLGINKDEARFNQLVARRQSFGARFVDGLLGEGHSELPDEYFDMIFSISVIEHIDDKGMEGVVKEAKRILRSGGLLANSVDIYFGSTKAKMWHENTISAGLIVQPPHRDIWEFGGNYTTFIESPKVRFMVYNSLAYKDPLNDGAPYVTQFATMLHIAEKP